MVSNSPVSEHSATREPSANGEQWESAHTAATHPATRVVGQQTLSAQVPTALMGAGNFSTSHTHQEVETCIIQSNTTKIQGEQRAEGPFLPISWNHN